MTKRTTKKRNLEQGATALLVVVFSILLITIITVGFLRLILRDQQRTTNDELSRGAYDAALAGVEDGKRVLQLAASGNRIAQDAISKNECNTIHRSRILSANDPIDREDEVLLTTGSSSSDSATSFDQAYTCVKIATQTATYQNSLDRDQSDVVPLAATGNFSELTISWHTAHDDERKVGGLPTAATVLPRLESWSGTSTVRPALMRLQLIQFKQNIATGDLESGVEDLDKTEGSSTLFLAPTSLSGASSFDFSTSVRAGGIAPAAVFCSEVTISGYACKATIRLPNPPGGDASERLAYLRVTPLYAAKASFEISLGGAADNIKFDNVEPSIDSTGRAANVFRRVDARVKHTSTSFAYPRATVDVTNNLCKNFGVTGSSYIPGAGPSCPIE